MGFKKMAAQKDDDVRLLSIREGAARYGLGLNTFRKFADDMGATIHIGKRVLFDRIILDEVVDKLRETKEKQQ